MKKIDFKGILMPKHNHFFSKKTFLRAVYFTGTLLYFTAGLCCGAHAQAQRSEVPKHFGEISPAKFPNTTDSLGIPKGGLKIGDTIPEALWHLPLQVVNHPEGKDTITLNDYRGKLIILDFWATWCTNCVVEFPKLYNLLEDLNAKFQILLVNSSEKGKAGTHKITSFFEKRKNVYELTSVINDEVLKALFPHRTIPHCIWLLHNKVLSITDSGPVIYQNVAGVVNRGPTEIIPKVSIDWDRSNPLFVHENGGNAANYLYRSFLSEYKPGLKSYTGMQHVNDSTLTRIYNSNASVWMLYTQAYPEYRDFTQNRIIVPVSKKHLFERYSDAEEWKSKHLFTYEVLFPPLPTGKALQFMRQDLARFFGLLTHLEYRTVDCWVLKANGMPKPVKPGVIRETNLYEPGTGNKFLRNVPFENLAAYLNSTLSIPVINETAYEMPVDLDLPADLTHINELQKSLKNQGFDLLNQKRQLEFLIFTEDN